MCDLYIDQSFTIRQLIKPRLTCDWEADLTLWVPGLEHPLSSQCGKYVKSDKCQCYQ